MAVDVLCHKYMAHKVPCLCLFDFTTNASWTNFSVSSLLLKFLSNMHSCMVNSSNVLASSLVNSIQLDRKDSKLFGKICKVLHTSIKSGSGFSFLAASPLFNSFHKLFYFAMCVDTSSFGAQLNAKKSVQILNNWSLDVASNCCFNASQASWAVSLSMILWYTVIIDLA